MLLSPLLDAFSPERQSTAGNSPFASSPAGVATYDTTKMPKNMDKLGFEPKPFHKQRCKADALPLRHMPSQVNKVVLNLAKCNNIFFFIRRNARLLLQRKENHEQLSLSFKKKIASVLPYY
jgi:hypothetical protein